MFRKLFDWLDHRTGYRKLMDAMLLEHIPGGAKWRYVWGSTLAFVFGIQLITGILLMFHYSPGDSTAWGSVFFIQFKMEFGWFIRGLHHFGSQTMVVLLGIHMLQVVIAGAHLPPREINWWLGLALMGIVFALSLTGYLLPWDQKGFWATQVATNIAGTLPELGPFIQKIVVGGSEYGHHTLTHFYALHVGVLPALLVVLLIAHIAVFRRHGITTPPGAKGEGMFWPDQAFRDMVVCMLVFAVMIGLVVFGGHGHEIPTPGERGLYDEMARGGRDGRGADLDAPADPSTSYEARPEWYFLFLFQLLKYFEGDMEIMGTVVIPNAVMIVLFILPLLGYGRMRKFGHLIGVIVVVALLLAVGALTYLAIDADANNEDYQKQQKKDRELARRAILLADLNDLADPEKVGDRQKAGVPEIGGRALLRGDPATRGRDLFKPNCGVCHSFTSIDASVESLVDPKAKYTASDLGSFGREKWIRGLLANPSDNLYFGRTQLGGMKHWRQTIDKARTKLMNRAIAKKDPKAVEKAKAEIAEEEEAFDILAKWLDDQRHPKDKRDGELEKKGFKAFLENCASCHSIHRESLNEQGKFELALEGQKQAPNFTDYGSQEWIRLMIMSPTDKLRYGFAPERNYMPAFRPTEGTGAEVGLRDFRESFILRLKVDFPDYKVKDLPVINHLSDFDRELIIRFMTYDHRVVFGGQEISGVKKK